MKAIVVLLATAVALTAAPAFAVATCDATTIPALIAKHSPGRVLVPPGVYCGDVFLPQGTSLASTDGAARTFIVGGSYGILLDMGEYMDVQGFTITGAALDGVHQHDGHMGGGISITDNVFHANGGWGINMVTMHDIFVVRNRFTADGLGGMRLAGEMMMGMSFQVYDNLFRDEPVAALYEEGMNGRFVGNVVNGGGVGVRALAFGGLRVYENMLERLDTAVDLMATCIGGVPIDVTEVAIYDNHLRNNGVGVLSHGGSDCGEPYGVVGLNIMDNRFHDHAGYAVDHAASVHKGIATAQDNYWGSDLGPSPFVAKVPGLGDMVSVGVNFSRWCTSLGCPMDALGM